jgi:hypothetical protein
VASSGYLIVEPGDDVRPVVVPQWTPALVDYEGHQAYGDLIARQGLKTRLRALTIFGRSMVKLLLKRTIKYELIPFDIRKDRSLPGRLRFIGAALANLVSGQTRRRRTAVPGENARLLERNGCLVLTMPGTQLAAIEAAARPDFDGLSARRGASSNRKRDFEESRWQASRAEQKDLFDQIEKALTDSGTLAAASGYLGRPARLIDVNPQINDASDGFWRDVFPDTGLTEIPATAYCHRDASGGDMKAIFYMTDVGDRNGPFSYVLGSNRMAVSKVDDLICEANDSNGLASTDPQARRLFAALPRKLRQKCSFGNDLTPGSELTREIQAGLWAIKAPKGSIVLFDTKGIHRGGMVEQGERRVITCVIG